MMPGYSIWSRIVEGSRARAAIAGFSLGLMPIVSFLLQYIMSVQAGTVQLLFQHITVTFFDWIFVPFNFFVVRFIDWRRAGVMFLATIISVVCNIFAHAFWQYELADASHMFGGDRTVLPAGWVHVAFSTLETVVILA